ncbi:RING finger protein 17 isoform X1 [Athalia rosae]|uniref:RING finger protein 17 isoform X1 n=2 Tax=Athalia rosae TaxID=37344 RepID=UPI00203437B7|nr:RING finger protein 17 isoform X1 [Athalia rosae]
MYSVDQRKLKYLACVSCKNVFFNKRGSDNNRGKYPRLLECGHSICEHCIKTSPKKFCDSCGTVFKIHPKDDPNIPINAYLMGIFTSNQVSALSNEPNLDFQPLVKARSKQLLPENLDSCSECGSQAEYQCRQCEVFFCGPCYTKIHGRALQNHQRILLGNNPGGVYKLLSNKCEYHSNQDIQCYCVKCKVSACAYCLSLSHQGHEIMPQSQKNEEMKEQLLNLVEKLAETRQRVKRAVRKLSKSYNYLGETHERAKQIEDIEAKITRHFVHLHGVLQNMELRFIKQLYERQHRKKINLEAVREELNEQKANIKTVMLLAQAAMDSSSDVNMEAIIQKLEETIDVPCHLVTNCVSDDDIVINIDESIVESLEGHCTLEISPVSNYSLLRTDDLPEGYEMEAISREEITDCMLSTIKKSPMTSSRIALTGSSPTLLPADRKPDPGLVERTNEAVRITHIKDPSCFYVQLLCRDRELEQLEISLAKQALTAAQPTEIALNKMYVVLYAKTSEWSRGRVTKVYKDAKGSDVCDVFYVDHGSTEIGISVTKMRNMSLQTSLIPIMSKRCALHDISPIGDQWGDDANAAMYDMVNGQQNTIMHTYRVCNDIYHVDILKYSAGDGDWSISVRDALIFLEYGCFVTYERLKRINPQSLRKYYEAEISIGNSYVVEVSHIESPDCIYLRESGHVGKYLEKLVKDMTAEYKGTKTNRGIIYTPQIGMPCAARLDSGLWYRARVSNLIGNRNVEVYFVDYGNTRVYQYDQIRRLQYKFMSMNALAFKVALKDVCPMENGRWSSESKKFTISCLHSKLLKIFVASKEDQCYKVIIYLPNVKGVKNFNAVLVKRGYALSTGPGSQKINKKKKTKKSRPLNTTFDDSLEDTMVADKYEESDPFKLQVNVLQVVSPDCIYVADVKTTTVIKQMTRKIQQFYNKHRSSQNFEWKKNDVCVAYSAKDKLYHRARITEIELPDKIDVFLYDIGIMETVSLDDLQYLHPKFSTIPARAFRVKLAGIHPCGGSNTWVSASSERLSEIVVANQDSEFYISKVAGIEDNAIWVELWVREARTESALSPTIVEINSINRKLVEEGVALAVKGYKDESKKVLATEVRHQLSRTEDPDISTDVKWWNKTRGSSCISNSPSDASIFFASNVISEFDLSSKDESDIEKETNVVPIPPPLAAWIPAVPFQKKKFFGVATNIDQDCIVHLHSLEDNAKMLEYIDAALQDHYMESVPEKCDLQWAPNDVCIALYHADHKWYRAQVLEAPEDGLIKVIFVDYGNVEVCEVGTLRKRVIMGHIPIQAIKCKIQGLVSSKPDGRWNTSELDIIHTILVDKQSQITILDDSDSQLLLISITLSEFKDMDLLRYLKYEQYFDIRGMESEKSFCEGSCNDGSDLIGFDSEDVIVEGCVDDYVRSAPAQQSLFINRCSSSSSELVSPIFKVDEKQEEILTGSLVVLKKGISIDSDISTGGCENPKLIIEIQSLKDLHSKNESFQRATSTPQNEEEDENENDEGEEDFIDYEYLYVPDNLEIVDLDPRHIESATVFYAQVDKSMGIEYIDKCRQRIATVVADMQNKAHDQPKLVHIRLGAPCCAKYDHDVESGWYRAKIVEILPNSREVQVQYVDFGNVEYQSIDKVHQLKEEWLAVPVINMRCRLWNIRADPQVSVKALLPSFNEIFYQGAIRARVMERFLDCIDVELYSDESCTELRYDSLIKDGIFEVVE